jgi:uroporphyrinogen III methyltransferase/synthase
MLSNKILITSPKRISKKNSSERPAPTAGFEKLKKQGFELIEFPTIKIIQSKNCKALDIAIQKINVYNYLLFTSKNSVNFFMQRFAAAGKTNKDLKGIKVCAIGRKTAEEIKKWKIKVGFISDEFNAEGLIKKIIKKAKESRSQGVKGQRNKRFKGLRFLLPRAEKTREILPDKIKKLGAMIDMPVIYKIAKPEVDSKKIREILNQKISVAAFTSASAFDNFTEMIGKKAGEFFKNTVIAVIGPVTARVVRKTGFRVSIMPRTATIESMANEMIRWLKKNKKCVCSR